MRKLLRARVARVRRLIRACLAHARQNGLDPNFVNLRCQLGMALARLDGLTRQFVDSDEVVGAVINARIAVLGLNDQIDAMTQDAAAGHRPDWPGLSE
jgi:hypothetical protein